MSVHDKFPSISEHLNLEPWGRGVLSLFLPKSQDVQTVHPRKTIVLECFLQPENCILAGAKKRTHCMQAYLWTSGNTLPLKDEHLTSDCRIKCHLHTCTKMGHLTLLSLQLHLAPRVWEVNALWRFQSALFNLLYVDNSRALCTVLVPHKLSFNLPFQKVHNNNCPNLFDPVWLAPWCLLLLPLFFSSPWSYQQRDPWAGHVGEPVERGGHRRPHARQLRCLPCGSAEPAGSHPSSSRFSEPIEVQWHSVLPDFADIEEFEETDAALALDHSWVPQRGKGNMRLRT